MTADRPIDAQRFIDARGLSHVQVLLLVLCFLVVALDGFDTIAWIAEQPWCNGKVATAGGSYAGQTQMFLAPTRPPAASTAASSAPWCAAPSSPPSPSPPPPPRAS